MKASAFQAELRIRHGSPESFTERFRGSMTPVIKVRAGGKVEAMRARRPVFSEKEGASVERSASVVSGAGKWPEIGDDLAFGGRSGVNPDVKKRRVNQRSEPTAVKCPPSNRRPRTAVAHS